MRDLRLLRRHINQDAQIRLIWLSNSRECWWEIRVHIAAIDGGRLYFVLLTTP